MRISDLTLRPESEAPAWPETMKSSLLLSKPPQSVSKPPSTGVRAAPDPTLDRDLVELLDRAAETFAILAGPVRSADPACRL